MTTSGIGNERYLSEATDLSAVSRRGWRGQRGTLGGPTDVPGWVQRLACLKSAVVSRDID